MTMSETQTAEATESTQAEAPAADAAATEEQTLRPGVTEQLGDDKAEQDSPDEGDDATGNADDAEDGGDEAESEETPGAPEQYEQFTLPEGLAVDEQRLDSFQEWAKEQNFSQEQAQKAVDYMTGEMDGLMQDAMKAQLDAYRETQIAWRDAFEKDPEIGGDKRQETEAAAVRALRTFGNPELVKLLDLYDPETNPEGMGLGNHPAVIRAFAKMGKLLNEDGNIAGDTDGSEAPIEDRWYGATTPKKQSA
jgi:hypothetical protein